MQVFSPQEYLKQICFEGIKYLPFYYYAKLSKIALTQLQDLFNEVHGYSNIMDRIKTDPKKLPLKLKDTGTQAYKQKKEIKMRLLNGITAIPNSKKEIRYLLQVLRSIDDINLIINELIELYKKPLRKLEVIGDFRATLCYLDFIENGT